MSILSFVWSLLVALFAIPSIIYVAHVRNLLDEPNLRTVHESLTPRLGGLAIFAGFVSSITIFGSFGEDIDGIQKTLAGVVLLFFIGLKDDVVSVSALKKFFVQLLATGIIMYMGDIRIHSFYGIFNIYELDIQLSYIITFLIVIGITNATNLIDGLDGLAGSIILLISLSFGVYFFLAASPYDVLAFSLAGGVLGFLRYNFTKATIFMGDTGSLVCGFLIAVLMIKFLDLPDVKATPAIAIAIMIIPILDTLRVFFLRSINGQSPFLPDKNHIHHRLMAMNIPQIGVVMILLTVNLVFIGLATFLSGKIHLAYILYILIGLAIFLSIILEISYSSKIKKQAH